MQIEQIWVVLAIILLLFEFWTISRVLKSAAPASSRLMWIAIIIFVPLFGMLAWLVAGSKKHKGPVFGLKESRRIFMNVCNL